MSKSMVKYNGQYYIPKWRFDTLVGRVEVSVGDFKVSRYCFGISDIVEKISELSHIVFRLKKGDDPKKAIKSLASERGGDVLDIDPFVVLIVVFVMFVTGIIAGLIFSIPASIDRANQERLACESQGGQIVEIYKSDDICIKKEYLISIKESKK